MGDGRSYYREGDYSTGKIIWVESDGGVTKLAESTVEESLIVLGAYNKHMYFAQGNKLYAHDGETITYLLSIGEGISNDSNTNWSPWSVYSNIRNNAFYITARTSSGSVDFGNHVTRTNEWRISDGLDLHPVSVTRNSVYTQHMWSIFGGMAYFNGSEYYAINHLHVDDEYNVERRDGGVVVDTLDPHLWKVEFVENNDRLFIRGELAPLSYGHQNGWVGDKKLYVIDNKDDSFVELASCANTED